ncbi:MAG: hypothetical protein ABIQ11_01180, partial [Saprospiraceae bacterium]
MLRGFLTISFVSILLCSSSVYGQSWTMTDPRNIETKGQRDIIPTRFVTYQADDSVIQAILFGAPHENNTRLSSSNTYLTVGLADGSTDIFRIVEYDMMEPGLAEKYPDIKTFRGISQSNPYRRIRADWTESGFRAVIRGPEGMTYIDPFQRNDLTHRIAYFRKDFERVDAWSCETEDIGAGI